MTLSDAARGRRVLFLTSSFPRWVGDGVTPFIGNLAQDLTELGWSIDILAPHAPGAAISETLYDLPVRRFRYWPTAGGQSLCYNGGALANLRASRSNYVKAPALVASQFLATFGLALRNRYDLIHAHWLLPQGFTAGLAGRLTGIPVVTTLHGGDAFALKGAVMSSFKSFSLGLCDAVTVNSSATEAAVLPLMPQGRLPVRIPMGACSPGRDDAAVEGLRASFGPGAFILLFVGRLVPEKGAEDLLRALPAILRDVPSARCVLVGDGPQRGALEDLASTLGVSRRVTFTGWLDASRLASWLHAADLFVGPSKNAPDGWVEAQGLTFAEAMLAGTCVLATRSGGIPDTVLDDETGVLVAPGRPDHLARAVGELAGDPIRRARLAKSGEEFARRFLTRPRSARAFSELYESLTSDNPAPAAAGEHPATTYHATLRTQTQVAPSTTEPGP